MCQYILHLLLNYRVHYPFINKELLYLKFDEYKYEIIHKKRSPPLIC